VPGLFSESLVATLGRRSEAGSRISQAKDDTGLRQIGWAHFDLHAVSRINTYKVLPEAARDTSQHHVLIGELNPEHGAREHLQDFAFEFD
jgi:hypothetical protein